VMQMARDQACPVVTVNPSTPVGPGDIKPTPTGRVIDDAIRGRMPAFVDTGLNIVHVQDVARGHLLALEQGVTGERYILGGDNLSLREMLVEVAQLAGRRPPRIRIPLPLAMVAAVVDETMARISGGTPQVTRDGVRMARKKMYFSSARARRELGYTTRPAAEALADAVAWFSNRI
jgi:dihydroflavonol-4-reductase